MGLSREALVAALAFSYAIAYGTRELAYLLDGEETDDHVQYLNNDLMLSLRPEQHLQQSPVLRQMA